MQEALFFIVYIVVFLYSVILHEIAHGYVALRYGDDTAKISGRLSFSPISHIDPFGSILMPLLLYMSAGFAFGYAKPVPVNPARLRGGASAYRMVALAGVATNFVLAVIAALILKVATQYVGITEPNNLGILVFQLIMVLNIVLAVFNSMPLPGFDGWNFLTTFPAIGETLARTPLGNPMFMARYGIFVSLLLLMALWPFLSSVISFFVELFLAIFAL